MNPIAHSEGSPTLTNTGSYANLTYARGDSEDSPKVQIHRKTSPVEVVRQDEFDRMLECFPSSERRLDVRARLILALMYYAGLRRSEVCNLRMDQVHTSGDDPRLEVRKSKFDKGRNIPVDPRLLPHIELWLVMRDVDSEYLVCTYQRVQPNKFAANPAPPGSKYRVEGVWNTVRLAKKRAEIERRIRPHMFRHAAATNWMRAGFSVREVQYLLGHENLQTTQRYLHVHDDEIAKKVYALGGMIPQATTHEAFSQPVATHKDCPYCAEPVRMAAIVCRWCNRDIAQATA